MWRYVLAAVVGLIGAFVFALLDIRDEWNYFLVLGAFAALGWTMLSIIGHENMQRLAAARRRRAHRR